MTLIRVGSTIVLCVHAYASQCTTYSNARNYIRPSATIFYSQGIPVCIYAKHGGHQQIGIQVFPRLVYPLLGRYTLFVVYLHSL